MQQLKRCIWFLIWVSGSFSILFPCLADEVYEQSDIPLLNNRFRIDHGAKQVTFLIYRKSGTNAAILVRPDGSKIYAWKLPKNVHWLELDTADIITIDGPMPGPWQAVAENDPRNRIRLLSDITLEVQPLPAQLYEHESLKLSSRLINKGKTLKLDDYLVTSMMTVSMIPTQLLTDPQLAHLEAKPLAVGHYIDDGSELDEVPRDGIFTALTKIAVKSGKYQVRIATQNEVFTRAYNQTVVVYPIPVTLFVIRDDKQEEPKITLKFDGDELDLASILILAQLKTPKGVSHNFTVIGDGSDEMEIPLPVLAEELGSYQITGTLFAVSRLGRELMITLPVKRFEHTPPPKALDLEAIAEAMALEEARKAQALAEKKRMWMWIWIGLATLGLLLLIVGVLFYIKQRKLKQVMASDLDMPAEEPLEGVSIEDELDLNMPEDIKPPE